MKKYIPILLLALSTTIALAQNKEKIKGSKTVITTTKEIGKFNAIETEDNLEVYLEKGEKQNMQIEADDNLHDIITFDLTNDILRVFTLNKIIKYKKLIVKITYTNDLNTISAKGESILNAIQQIQLDSITIKSFDNASLFLNVNSKNFVLQSDGKSSTELNLKSENAKIELSKDASLKSLITATNLDFDLYQKSKAIIEGDATNATIRLDNNSKFTGNKLTLKNVNLIAEGYSESSINATSNITITAGEKSQTQLIGEPKIEILKFSDEAKLLKKIK